MSEKKESVRRPPRRMQLAAQNRSPVLLPEAADDAGPRVRVGVLALIWQSWAIFFSHLDIFLMLMWRPFALTAAVALGVVEALPHIGPGPAAMLFTVVGMSAIVPVVTAWHRMILLGADNPDARVTYRIGKPEWTYFRAAAALYGLGYVIGLAVNELYGPLLGGPVLWLVREGIDPAGLLSAWGPAAIQWGSVALILGFLVARFFLVLPAAAVGAPMSVSESASATRGNGLRLVAAYILASLPAAALTAVFAQPAAVLASAAPAEEMFLDLILAILPRILLYTIAVGILSLAFERLVGVPKRLRR
ncbi:MAG: hypothetical protein ACMVY4_04145 [Minwuia sp.]|uniref:hypothetical protein n=1 Tax=Minwuia sp. TaxID=2493630 RepID=UPI003A89538E